ncbi:hypothetical protein GCM10020254_52630 [Streptomyces goshikiensis]
MGLVIGSTSVLLMQLSAPEEAGANSAALQISDALANVVLLAGGRSGVRGAGGRGGGCGARLRRRGRGLAPRGVRGGVPADGLRGVGGGAWVATRLHGESED